MSSGWGNFLFFVVVIVAVAFGMWIVRRSPGSFSRDKWGKSITVLLTLAILFIGIVFVLVWWLRSA